MKLKSHQNLLIHTITIAAALLICVVSWFSLSRIETGLNSDIEKSLKVTLDTAQKAAHALFKAEKSSVQLWANDEMVKELVKELLQTKRTPVALNKVLTQQHIRNIMKPLLGTLGYKGFFIIAPDGINIASSRKGNVGTINLLVKQEGFLNKVWSGKTLVSLPQRSDVPLENTDGKVINTLSTMFAATQIKNETGQAIAILAFRIDPGTIFSPIFERGRIGPSGETYAFNRQGVMISESRFNEQLYSLGLIVDPKYSNINIDIRDPGVNLTLGERSTLKRNEMPLTLMASSATKGESAINMDGYRDYRGVPVVGAWLWDDELGFGITTEIDFDEAHFRYQDIRFVVLIFALAALILMLIVSFAYTSNRKRIYQEKLYFSSIINNTAEGIITIDQHSIIETINPAIISMFGYSEDELVGSSVSILVPKDDREKHTDIVKNSHIHAPLIINQARDLYGEHKDGYKIPLELNVAPMDMHGERKFVGIMHDITERKKKENELKTMLSAVAQSPSIVVITDIKGNIEYVNPRFVEISGYTEDEVIGENPRKGKSGKSKPEDYKEMWRTISSGNVWKGEFHNRRKDGSEYWVSASIAPVMNEYGLITHYVAVEDDITEKKSVEVVLHEKQKLIDLLHSVTTIANESLDINDALQGSLEMVCKYLDWPVGHVYLRSFTNSNKLMSSKIWYLEEPEKFASFVEVTEETEFFIGDGMPGRVFESKQFIWLDDATNEPKFLRAQYVKDIVIRGGIGFPVVIEDEVFAVLEFFTPNTLPSRNQELQATLTNIGIQLGRVVERSNAQENLQLAKLEAEKANHAKSDFLSSMSHELRTPLNSILGFSQLLLLGDDDSLTDEQKDSVNYISKGGEHLLELINEVLDLAKIEAGKATLDIGIVNTRDLIDECLSYAMILADKRNIVIEDNSSEVISSLWTDKLRSKQAILNLLSNAVKYNHESGTIKVNTEKQNNNMLRISITDTGLGIPKQMQSKVFQPFNRLGAETTEIEGTGIGLTLTKELVEKMGGIIGFKSTEGQGSTFWIDFPVSNKQVLDKSSGQQETIASDMDMINGEHLLLYVEDNPANLALMKGIIKRIPNIRMISAHSAELGIALAEEMRPDVIIFDINLPGMNGIEAVQYLKKSKTIKDIPVLALSADIMPNTIKLGIESGFIDYLTKPVNLPKLITALKDALGKVA